MASTNLFAESCSKNKHVKEGHKKTEQGISKMVYLFVNIVRVYNINSTVNTNI